MGIRLILLFLYMLISIDLTQFVTRLISSQAGCRCKHCILQYVYEMWGVLLSFCFVANIGIRVSFNKEYFGFEIVICVT